MQFFYNYHHFKLLVMRGSVIGLLLALFSLQIAFAFPAESQGIMDTKVSIRFNGQSLEEAFHHLHKRVGVDFVYSSRSKLNKKVRFHVKDKSLGYVMNRILLGTPLTYDIVGNKVVIHRRMQTEKRKIKTLNALITISGTVQDQLGTPLPGVSVQVVGTTRGTITNNDGKYSIQVKPTDSLRFSSIGYQTQTLAVRNRVDLDIVMHAAEGSLNQVVVVGYGKQKKISMVGSQSSVDVAKLKLPEANLSAALAGRIAGVISVQRGGAPGYNAADIWIRGISTFSNGLSKPLVLVDGVPRNYNNIDPENIASFTILKDAAATAVYGVRGANGVILITTKKGKIGKPAFKFRYNEGITTFTRLPHFTDGVTYMKAANEASLLRGGSPIYTEEAIQKTKDHSDPDFYPDVNWFDEIFRKLGHTRTANLNVNGGSEHAKYYVGLSYYDETGLFKQDSLQKYSSQARFKRYNLITNLTINATNSTKVLFGVHGYLANVTNPGTAYATIFGDAYFLTPVDLPAVYSNGKIAAQANYRMKNPYAELTQTGYVNQWRASISSNLQVIQNLDFLIKGLSASAKFGFDAYNSVQMKRKKVPETYTAQGRDSSGNLILVQTNPNLSSPYLSYSKTNGGTRTLYNELRLNYKTSIGKNNIGAMLLYNQSDKLNTHASSVVTSLPYRFRGIAGRATYGYDDKYFAEFDFGYNGSENFAPDNRYGFFPSLGVGWVISKEKFFKPLHNIFQLFKLRFSYGLVGSSEISGRRFAYIATVGSGNGSYPFGIGRSNNIGGKDIDEYASDVTWETSKKTNLGINVNMLKGKISLQADLFKSHRSGIFLQRNALPYYLGIRKAPYANIGIIDNHGVDGTLTWRNHLGKFHFQLIGNFTWTRNKDIEDARPHYKYPWLERKGRKVGQTFGYIALGLFKDEKEIENSPEETGDVRPGDIKFKDINGDGKINAYDEVPIGYGNIPEIVYGLGFTFNYKNFSLSGLFQGVGNVDISLSGTGLLPFKQGLTVGNLLSNIKDRWTPENPSPHPFYPRLMKGGENDNYATSTWWLRNGAYVRLKSVQFSYTLPHNFLKKIHLKNAYVFLQGLNVLTLSSFKLYDVELGNGNGSEYPNTKTYSIGFGFKF